MTNPEGPQSLDTKERAQLILDFFHRIIIHHGLWYGEVVHQMGPEKAREILDTASRRSFAIRMQHLGKMFAEAALPLSQLIVPRRSMP